MNSLIFHLVAVGGMLAYLGAAIYFVKTVRSKLDEASYLVPRRILICGIGLHILSFLLLGLGFGPELWAKVEPWGKVSSFPYALSLISLFIALMFLLLERRFEIGPLGAFLMPVILVFNVSANFIFHLDREFVSAAPLNPILGLHVTAALLGFALFAVSFAVSLALLVKEVALKKRRLYGFQKFLPSIHLLDSLHADLIGVGLLIMAFSVGVGTFIGLERGYQIMITDPRLLWSVGVLLLYAIFAAARVFWGWRGRRAALLSLGGFVFLVGSLYSVHFSGGSFHAF